jgi:hypothetical protein
MAPTAYIVHGGLYNMFFFVKGGYALALKCRQYVMRVHRAGTYVTK